METSKKIIRAKVKLQNENPFFAYLLMNMRYKEDKSIKTIGVNNEGDCFYNPKFIDELNEDILKGILAHEVLHIVLEHLARGEKLNHKLYNVATDLCVNDILIENGFYLDNRGLIPYNHSYSFEKKDGSRFKVEDINKKTAEMIYQELLNNIDNEDDQDKKRFDVHLKPNKKDKDKTPQALKGKWKKIVSEGLAYARQKGNMTDSLGLFIDELLNEKVNWKSLLYKYLTKTIPHDYTYNRPSRRSFAIGVYTPSMRRESIEIVVSLDTSASISKTELTEFMTEINGIAKSFNNLSMKLIVCDQEIQEVYSIGNGDNDKIKDLIIKGGGGTSHKPVYDYIKNNLPNTKLLVNFTDGYTDFDELDDSINTLWVICKDGINEDRINFGEVIKLK